MSKFLNALSRVGLVELEADDSAPSATVDMAAIDAMLADAGIDADAIPDAIPETAPPPPAAKSPIVEGRPFAEVYTAGGVPVSPLTADKLLKILDGLQMMDHATRRAAVMAMDAAEDAWTVEDAQLDAKRKIDALSGAKASIDNQIAQAEAEAQSIQTDADLLQANETTRIRDAIQALEADLETIRKSVADAKATANAELEAARGAGFREKARFDTEIARMREIATIFGSAADRTSTPTETK